MDEYEELVKFRDDLVEALREDQMIIFNFEGRTYQIIPYSLEEQIADEFDEKEVAFKFEAKRIKNEKMESEGDRRTGETPGQED